MTKLKAFCEALTREMLEGLDWGRAPRHGDHEREGAARNVAEVRIREFVQTDVRRFSKDGAKQLLAYLDEPAGPTG